MLTPQDTPTATDVLRGHQATPDGGRCTCGRQIGGPSWMADHQLGVLQASGLAVVSVHGTAGIVQAAVRVVGAMRVRELPPPLQVGMPLDDALAHLRERVEALTR